MDYRGAQNLGFYGGYIKLECILDDCFGVEFITSTDTRYISGPPKEKEYPDMLSKLRGPALIWAITLSSGSCYLLFGYDQV